MNPFNGIERKKQVDSLSPAIAHGNPFNGIERLLPKVALGCRAVIAQNPFNGIES